MEGCSPQLAIHHPPWTSQSNPPPWPPSLGSQMARRLVSSSFHHNHHHHPTSTSTTISSSSISSSFFPPPHQYPIVYNPSHAHLPMSVSAPQDTAPNDDYYPTQFPFDTHDLPASHSFSHDFFPSPSDPSALWHSSDKSAPSAALPLSPPKREPSSQHVFSPSHISQSASGRFYESSARLDDPSHSYGQHHQHQHPHHQQQQQQQHQADYASADLSPLQSHHVFYGTHDPTEPYPPGHRHAHRRHPSSSSVNGGVVPADFFAPPPQAYIEPAELDYPSPPPPPPQPAIQPAQPLQTTTIGVPFPSTDTPSPPEYGSSPGLTDDSAESDAGEDYDDDEDDDDDDEYNPEAGRSRRRRRRSTMSSTGYSDASLPFARKRRVGRAAVPVPVPNLTKKSRGRRVPTAPVIVTQGGIQKDLRTFCCTVTGCGKRFARGEHLKRHVRSIHTNEKPHKCPAPGCGKEFSRHDNLGQHMRVHKGYRPEY